MYLLSKKSYKKPCCCAAPQNIRAVRSAAVRSPVPPWLRDQTGSGAPGRTGWLHFFSMGSSAVTVTAMAPNSRTHAQTHINTHTNTHTHTESLPIHTCTHSQKSGTAGADVGWGWGWGHMGIAPTGGTLLDLWMRQKSHYGLLWLADRPLSAAELHTKAAGRSKNNGSLFHTPPPERIWLYVITNACWEVEDVCVRACVCVCVCLYVCVSACACLSVRKEEFSESRKRAFSEWVQKYHSFIDKNVHGRRGAEGRNIRCYQGNKAIFSNTHTHPHTRTH